MPIEWLAIIAAAALVIVVTSVIVYTLSMARTWIREQVGNLRNRQIVTGAVKQRLANDNYKIVPFIFDEKAQQIVNATAVEAEMIESDLEDKFGPNKIALIEP